MITPIVRFLNKTQWNHDTLCWHWSGGLGRGGYGAFWYKGKTMPAHRWSYEYFIGPIPKNKFVCHECDNPSCVNPYHLWIGGAIENVSDMVSKNRQAKGSKQGLSKLTEKQVKSIRKDNRLQTIIAKEFGIDQTQVSNIKTKKHWRHI